MKLDEAIKHYGDLSEYYGQKAKDNISDQQECKQLEGWLKELQGYRLQNAAFVEPEEEKPHWIFYTRLQISHSTKYICSACRETITVKDDQKLPKKCPKCGTVMMGDTE